MLKMVKPEEATIADDPTLLDRANWQRVREAVDKEVVHPDWGCALYRLHRTKRITNDQREAGDRYAKIVLDYKKTVHEPIMDVLGIDISQSLNKVTGHIGPTSNMIASAWADNLREQSELEIKREERSIKRYKEAAGVAGPARVMLEDLVIGDIWPIGERGHMEICHALTRLSHFFSTGTKRKR